MSPRALLAALLPALLTASLTACRGGLNSTCHCAADCRSGLACSAEGEKKLLPDTCFAPGISGSCVEANELDSDSGDPASLTESDRHDFAHSRRDFAPAGSLSDSLSGTTAPTAGPETTTDAGTGSSSTGTSTGDTTSTGTSTGTTGTTSTSTGTTGTTSTSTGDSSTGSSGSSGSTSSSGSSGSSSTT